MSVSLRVYKNWNQDLSKLFFDGLRNNDSGFLTIDKVYCLAWFENIFVGGTVDFTWRNRNTGEVVYTYRHNVPSPSSQGFESWAYYGAFSWIDNWPAGSYACDVRLGGDLAASLGGHTRSIFATTTEPITTIPVPPEPTIESYEIRIAALGAANLPQWVKDKIEALINWGGYQLATPIYTDTSQILIYVNRVGSIQIAPLVWLIVAILVALGLITLGLITVKEITQDIVVIEQNDTVQAELDYKAAVAANSSELINNGVLTPEEANEIITSPTTPPPTTPPGTSPPLALGTTGLIIAGVVLVMALSRR